MVFMGGACGVPETNEEPQRQTDDRTSNQPSMPSRDGADALQHLEDSETTSYKPRAPPLESFADDRGLVESMDFAADRVVLAYEPPPEENMKPQTPPAAPSFNLKHQDKVMEKLKKKNGPGFMTRMAQGEMEAREGPAAGTGIILSDEQLEALRSGQTLRPTGNVIQTGIWNTTIAPEPISSPNLSAGSPMLEPGPIADPPAG